MSEKVDKEKKLKFFCRGCQKIKYVDKEGFCSEKCKEKFIRLGLCGFCDGRGSIPCMAGGRETCPSCNGTGKGKYTTENGFC